MYLDTSFLAVLCLITAQHSFGQPSTSQAPQQQFRIHHRFLSPSSPDQSIGSSGGESSWKYLDTITTDSSNPNQPYFLEANAAEEQVGSDSNVVDDSEDGWYQVGIPVDEDALSWRMASTPVCYMSKPPLNLTIHMTENHITSLSIHPASPPYEGCSSSSSQRPRQLPGNDGSKWNLRIKRPDRTYGPNSAPPAKADPSTGLPQTPPPEKSFLQKYWLPLLGAAVFLIGQMGASNAEPQGQGQGQAARGS